MKGFLFHRKHIGDWLRKLAADLGINPVQAARQSSAEQKQHFISTL